MEKVDSSLRVSHLNLSYEQRDTPLVICDDVSLNFRPGEIVGILGPNGCGKSTLLKAILGTKALNQGQITFGPDAGEIPKITFIPQNFRSSFFVWASLMNNIRFTMPGFLSNWRQYEKKILTERDDFNIEVDFRLKPHNCSGGMLQQSAIIRAFVSHDGIVVGDEPFSALDVTISANIRSVFRQKVTEQRIIAILILHNLDDIISMCDRVLVIPNKPFSSNKREGYHQLKDYPNHHLTNFNQEQQEHSLAHTAQKLFDHAS